MTPSVFIKGCTCFHLAKLWIILFKISMSSLFYLSNTITFQKNKSQISNYFRRCDSSFESTFVVRTVIVSWSFGISLRIKFESLWHFLRSSLSSSSSCLHFFFHSVNSTSTLTFFFRLSESIFLVYWNSVIFSLMYWSNYSFSSRTFNSSRVIFSFFFFSFYSSVLSYRF